MNLNTLLGLPGKDIRESQKIIVLVPGAAKGNNIGIIVDDVSSVRQVPETDIEHIGAGISSEFSQFVKGIIKVSADDNEKKKKDLIIWLDMEKVIADLGNRSKNNPGAGIVHESD
jgi:purine-binding chemotaxis protein CheW